MEYRKINRKGVELSEEQLEKYLEKLASEQVLQEKSSTDTYPIPKLKEDFEFIEDVYHLLNYHVKQKIPIHPAGEWLLDNFYIIEETFEVIMQNMPLKKYKNFLGIANGTDSGFARIYILAYDLVNYTDNNLAYKKISKLISAYQKKKTLSMDEVWNLGIFMQIAIIQNISEICEKIYISQIQKAKAEDIFERLVLNNGQSKLKINGEIKKKTKYISFSYIEYLSYKLKNEGKQGIPFINALEEQVNKMGFTIDEIVRKEHYDIALNKVSMANCITSMKELLRMDFLSIFEDTNEVEEILNNDPMHVYNKMDYKTKEYYRSAIENISKNTKVAEIYIAKKALELAKENIEKADKTAHIGYYLIDAGKEKLYKRMQHKYKQEKDNKKKVKIYFYSIWCASFFIDLFFMCNLYMNIKNGWITGIIGLILVLPIQEIVTKVVQYFLSKIVKPKLIPKLDFSKGVPEEESTFVVIPTILKSKEKVEELIRKLEVYYLSNKSENIYFALLGDCSSGLNKEEPFDKEIIEEGKKQIELLNKKYECIVPKFYFTYRKRYWNGSEECYLGWERKRGLLSQFNSYILGKIDNPFLVNTMENNLPDEIKKKIKYVITLDSDTELILNSGLKLIGSMAHILNKPVLNKQKDLVIEGHGLIQPRIGINLKSLNKSVFSKIFAGNGGIDNYTNAISDIYQDNFDEGIFTGKGIYDVHIFSEVLEKEIPENTVLSHDLLEGSYLRCGLASDIVLMDGYPTNYISSRNRLHRWIRGDFQIIRWAGNKIINNKEQIKENPLNELSKFKIIDNMIRTVTPVYILLLVFVASIINNPYLYGLAIISAFISTILDLSNNIIFKKDGQSYQRTFSKRIPCGIASILRGILKFGELPDRVYYSFDAVIRTIYRMRISKKHFLEWTTSEEAEKLSKKNLKSYYKTMFFNVVAGILIIGLTLSENKNQFIFINNLIFASLWFISPFLYFYIGKEKKKKDIIKELNDKEKEYLNEVGRKTWQYFKDGLVKENNYLPPDNYQEDRKIKFVPRTSSTNIGLGILSVISSYDLGYENLEDTLTLLKNMVITIEKLPKWNGHLYNWYNIKTLEPLSPRYVSTVDNGNYVGYIYVLKEFYKEIKKKNTDEKILKLIPKWVDYPINEIEIANCDFSKLYNEKKGLFSIGFNVEENKLTDSYYDLLASEARQASIIAISKKDVESKHWSKLSRTMTKMNGYNGLISWSGTAFEYLMPTIIIDEPDGSLLNESVKYMIMNQKKYAKRLSLPWGFSESAYNLKDLNGNYQYKAIGIPWLGLKRGLEEDIVVSSYASIMAITEEPKEVIKNIKILENEGMYDKYGFYESIDYTPIRMPKGKNKMVVKTYMAHHQGLILLSINNFFNDSVLKKRFSNNPEISAVEILLQETMPEKKIITKEEKQKPEKITYHDYENYAQRVYTKINNLIPICNVISSDDYSIVTNIKGEGYSKYKNYYINKYIIDSEESQGIVFYIKNIKNKKIWKQNILSNMSKKGKVEITFGEDKNKIKRIDEDIESISETTIAPNIPLEIKKLRIINNGSEEKTLEITTAFEPIIDSIEAYTAHPTFENLFLLFEYDKEKNIFIIKSKSRRKREKEIYLAASFFTNEETIGDLEYEIDKAKFNGRNNFEFPEMIENSKPFSNKIDYTINPILALRETVNIKSNEEICFNFLISISENKEEAINNIIEYKNEEKITKAFELSRAKADAVARYLDINSNEIKNYQKMLGYILFPNNINSKKEYKKEFYAKEELWKFGISGDLPIIVVKIKNSNEVNVLREVLKAYEFFRMKNIQIDLVIINKEPNSYEKYVKEVIQDSILNFNMGYLINNKGGIYILDNEAEEIVEFYSKLIINTKNGPLNKQIEELEEEFFENEKTIGEINKEVKEIYENNTVENNKIDGKNLLYFNEYGGFKEDGKEYIIQVENQNKTPTVWSHIIANKGFGTVTTENMGGYTWCKNSRLNKITSWNNNQVTDEPSEIIYVQDKENLIVSTIYNSKKHEVLYGFGYANYQNSSNGINQEINMFVPNEDNIKILLMNIKNMEPKKRKVRMYYYAKLVMGEDSLRNNRNINIKFYENNNILILKNKTNTDYKNCVYFSCSEKIKSFTGNRDFFIGNGNINNPEALNKVSLDNRNCISNNGIIAYQIEIELEAYENKDIVFMIGSEEKEIDAKDKAYQYLKISRVEDEFVKVKNNWQDFLGRIQVYTPVDSFNILMNGWLIYQTYTSRIMGRTSFYQCGGAYGFRDQLQDTIALKYFSKDIMKEQIIKHSKHQFLEGDVEHWWHEETRRGIRTKFSDDLLWLVYVVEDYISYTNDFSILDIETPYLIGEELKENEDERYEKYEESNIKESIYEHCKKALKRGINLGENGLCKIGSGDWNDGMSNVGNKGKGESIWLSFFVYDILKKWIQICIKKQEDVRLIDEYYKIAEVLRKNVNDIGWDGRWYRRAFTDDGDILGSIQNDECKIDGIAQSWSVISNAGDEDKKKICMESLENHLVDKENGIIKLLDPPFEKSKLEPGYIKDYLPGTRENGGQYTHAAIWTIIAEAKLGFGDEATELFRMINPIEHSKTKELANKYKVEPYVVSADIYGQGNLAGRGGWTWYTGSSSWMYETGLHYILGLNIQDGYLSIKPCIPKDWKEYKIRYKYNNSIYNIYVSNPKCKNTGIEEMRLNGEIVKENKIKLEDNNKVNEIKIIM